MTTTDFKIWNEYNSTSGLGKTLIRHPYLSIAPKGKLSFSVAATEGLKITQDSRIIFVEGNDGSFFVCKTKDSGLMFCKKDKTKHSKNYLQLSAPLFSEYVAEKFGFEKRVHVRVSLTPETFPKKQQDLPAAGFRLYFNEIKK